MKSLLNHFFQKQPVWLSMGFHTREQLILYYCGSSSCTRESTYEVVSDVKDEVKEEKEKSEYSQRPPNCS